MNLLFFLAYVLLPLLLSFYIFNFPPAKIFLGDVGSIPLGYIIGYLMIYMLSINEFFIFFTMFLYPILDVGFNLIRKTINCIYPWSRSFDYYFLIPVIIGVIFKLKVPIRTVLASLIIIAICISPYAIYKEIFFIPDNAGAKETLVKQDFSSPWVNLKVLTLLHTFNYFSQISFNFI